MSHIPAALVAGLGLFFLGLHLVGSNLQLSSSRQFRSLFARFTDRTWRGSLLGLFAGVCMQSTSAVVVILASMTAGGLVSVRQALPIVTWTNVGATLIVFIGIFNPEVAVLYALGLTALVFVFSGDSGWKPVCGALLGVSLLFYAIHVMKTSAAGLQDYAWFKSALEQASGSHGLAFAAGAMLSLVTQSTTATALIALAFAQAGMFRVEETMMIIYGGNLGSTFSRMLLAAGLKGSSRQIGRFQDLFKIAGSTLFVLLFYIEVYTGLPLVRALVAAISDRLETQTALINFFCNLAPAILFTPLLGPIQRLLDHLWPATEAEDFAKLRYLHPQALSDPDSALDLIDKEQARLLARLPDYANALRKPDPGKRRTDVRALHQAFGMLFKEVQAYCIGLVHAQLAPATSERLTNVHDRQGVIGFLEETVHSLVTSVEQTPPSPQLASLVNSMTEALDFLLTTAAEAATTLAGDEADLMAALCGDRGELLGKIRTLYLSADHGLRPSDKALLLDLTTHFDRIVWLVRRLAALLQQNQRFRP